MVQTNATIVKSLKEGVHAWWGMTYDTWKPEWKDIFETYTSKRFQEEEVALTGYGYASVKTQGGSISYDTMMQGPTSRYTHVVYAKGYITTREEIEDSLYPQLTARRSKGLMFSGQQTQEVVGINVLNRAFNNSYLGGDGLELCSTVHVNTAGGTYSNKLATAADLSEASLEQMCIDASKMTNDRGLKIKILPQLLIIPPDLIFDAERIMKSVLQNDTANNAINALRSMSAIPQGYTVNHYLTDADAYFLKTNCPEGLKHFSRRPMALEEDNDFDTQNLKVAFTMRFSFGWTDPRAIIGTPGA